MLFVQRKEHFYSASTGPHTQRTQRRQVVTHGSRLAGWRLACVAIHSRWCFLGKLQIDRHSVQLVSFQSITSRQTRDTQLGRLQNSLLGMPGCPATPSDAKIAMDLPPICHTVHVQKCMYSQSLRPSAQHPKMLQRSASPRTDRERCQFSFLLDDFHVS